VKTVKTKRIIISRVDNIGDVILTLPVAGVIKRYLPEMHVIFLGKNYTKTIIDNCKYIDQFLNWDQINDDISGFQEARADAIIHVFPNREVAKLAREVRIKKRIGTSHRSFHWNTCTRLVNLGRMRSNLHEAQLNIKLLKPFGIKKTVLINQIPSLYGWPPDSDAAPELQSFFNKEKFNLIIHMKSFGNAKEWVSENYLKLVRLLPTDKFNIILTGTKEEGKVIQEEVPAIFQLNNVNNLCGKFDLETFIRFIQSADGMLACSTGPLHVAAAAGIRVLGLYPGARPKNPVRWGPIGIKAETITDTNPLDAPLNIPVEPVRNRILSWLGNS
jgi:ADP-heptose:LPS heptosyltransferase